MRYLPIPESRSILYSTREVYILSLIVQKFGGSSVKDAERVRNVASIVTEAYKKGNDVVVVVSAQGDTTDDLIEKAAEITAKPSQREMDMLLASGEQISASLLAMCIQEMGCPAISLTGWQAGFLTSSAHTSARIRRVNPDRIRRELGLYGLYPRLWNGYG